VCYNVIYTFKNVLFSPEEQKRAFVRFKEAAEHVVLYYNAFPDFASILFHGTEERARPSEPTPERLAHL
jgi:hypothetical protein